MLRNNILTNYLLLGICGISSMLMSCNKMTNNDYRADSDWVYQNHSSHELHIVLGSGEYDDSETNFILPVDASHIVELRSFSITDNLQATDFSSPYQYHGATVKIGSTKYAIAPNEKFANVGNYLVEKLGTNYFRFTYIFTDENIAGQTP